MVWPGVAAPRCALERTKAHLAAVMFPFLHSPLLIMAQKHFPELLRQKSVSEIGPRPHATYSQAAAVPEANLTGILVRRARYAII